MNFWSFIKEIISPLVAVISVYLVYKAGISPYREALYSKQIDIYSELAKAINDLYWQVSKFFPLSKDVELNDKLRSKILSKTEDSRKTFKKKFMEWYVFLPPKVIESILKFIYTFQSIMLYPLMKDKILYDRFRLAFPDYIVNTTKDPMGLIEEAFKNIYITFSKNLGTKELSLETLRMIRKMRSY